MYERIGNVENFHFTLAAGKRMMSLYLRNQKVIKEAKSIPNLCKYFKVGKTKLYEILQTHKYSKEKPPPMKTPRRVKMEKIEPPEKKAKTST